jgi:hypothetical protein
MLHMFVVKYYPLSGTVRCQNCQLSVIVRCRLLSGVSYVSYQVMSSYRYWDQASQVSFYKTASFNLHGCACGFRSPGTFIGSCNASQFDCGEPGPSKSSIFEGYACDAQIYLLPL